MSASPITTFLGIHDKRAVQIAHLGLWLSLPMWIGFLGFLSFLAYVPGMEGLGLERLAGLSGFFGFSGFLGLLGVASTIDAKARRKNEPSSH